MGRRRIIFTVAAICALTAVSGAFAAGVSDAGSVDTPLFSANDETADTTANTAVDTDADIAPDTAPETEPPKDKSEKTEAPADEPAPKPKKDKSGKAAESAAATPAAPSGGGRAEREVTDFRLSGTLEAGFDINNRVTDDRTESRIIGKGTLEISARPVRRIRAEMGIEYDIRDTFLVVDKLYGQYSITKPGTIRAGIMKKAFGLEERTGVEERYFHRRSIINASLEDMGFLGHDLTLQYRHDINRDLRLQGSVSWSTEDSLRYLHNYFVSYDLDSSIQFGLSAIIMHNGDKDSWLATSYALALSSKHTSILVSEAELTFGLNPNPRTKWIEGRDAYILGVRVKEQYPITLPWQSLREIIPLAELAMYWEDVESGSFDTQLRAGLTLGFANKSAYQFRNTFEVRWRMLDGETNVRRYRFDSQVVVIF
ncbi:MAG: hypothetical protein FWB94_02635 [Chitinispirillia bacterium]|nr:hypothetical protein [Chitinispirillia bacterium]